MDGFGSLKERRNQCMHDTDTIMQGRMYVRLREATLGALLSRTAANRAPQAPSIPALAQTRQNENHNPEATGQQAQLTQLQIIVRLEQRPSCSRIPREDFR